MNKEKVMGIEVGLSKEVASKITKELAEAKLKLRGRIFTGKLISKDTHNSAVIEWNRQVYLPKYERYMKKKSKLKVHNPNAINANIGDIVKAVETRPISKSKCFVIIDKLKK